MYLNKKKWLIFANAKKLHPTTQEISEWIQLVIDLPTCRKPAEPNFSGILCQKLLRKFGRTELDPLKSNIKLWTRIEGCSLIYNLPERYLRGILYLSR